MKAFLHSPAFVNSPLAILSPGARKRFLSGLHYGSEGIGGFAYADLEAELTADQINQVMRLIGADSYLGAFEGNEQSHARYALETAFDLRFTAMQAAVDEAQGDDVAEVVRGQLRLLFPSGVSKAALSSVNSHDLGLALRALGTAAFHDAAEESVTQMLLVLDLLKARDAVTDAQVLKVHRALVARRRFAEAESLERDFAEVELTPVPRHRQLEPPTTKAPTLLSVFDGGNGLRREARPLDHGLQIVVVASCHFSKDAARAIEGDPSLAKLFREHATWLASKNESFGRVADWNAEFPDQPIHIAWSDDEWPMLDSWAMPTFYVFRDGIKLAQWSGWPADTGMQTLRDQLARIGID